MRKREQISDKLRDNVWAILNVQFQHQIDEITYNSLHDILCDEKRYKIISHLYLHLRHGISK